MTYYSPEFLASEAKWGHFYDPDLDEWVFDFDLADDSDESE